MEPFIKHRRILTGIAGALATLAILVGFAVPALSLSPPPGTIITNQAIATFSATNNYLFEPVVSNTVSTEVGPGSTLLVSATANPDPVAVGDILSYIITITNTGNIQTGAVTASALLSGDLQFQSATNGGTFSPGGAVSWNIGSIPSGGSVVVTVSGKVNGGVTIPFSFSAYSPGAATASTSLTTQVGMYPNLTIVDASSVTTVNAGGTITYTINYANIGNRAAKNVYVINDLPSGTALVAGSITGGGLIAGRTITWPIGALQPGVSGSVSFKAIVSSIANIGDIISNASTILSNETAVVPSNQVSVTVTALAAPLLTISETTTATTVSPGGTITYTVSYTNSGAGSDTGVVIKSDLPTGTALVAGSVTGGGSLSGSTITWPIGSLAAGGSGSVSFQVTVPTSVVNGIINNASTISSNQTSSVTSNQVSVTVTAPQLSITKSVATDTAHPGNPLAYEIVVKNIGALKAFEIQLRDPLAAGVSHINSDGGGIAFGSSVNWYIDALDPGASVALHLNVMIDKSFNNPSVSNTAYVSASGTGELSSSVDKVVTPRTSGLVEFIDAVGANSQKVHQYLIGDKLCVQVTDADRNSDQLAIESVSITIDHITRMASGSESIDDSVTAILTESTNNSSIFQGCIASNGGPATVGDAILSLGQDTVIRATYNDPLDADPVSTASAFIDPFGVVFDSTTGLLVNNAIVRLIDDATGMDAILPQPPLVPVSQENPVTTSSNGRFQFQYVNPGTYHFVVSPRDSAAVFTFPSLVADADLPSGYIILPSSRGNSFTLSAGMQPLNLDIPVDPPPGQLIVTKTASKTIAAIGDILVYSLKVTNSGTAPVRAITFTDLMPHGVQILPGSSRLNGLPLADPTVNGKRTFAWSVADLAPEKSLEISYRAVVGPDSHRGDGINSAFASGQTVGQTVTSNTARAKVKITEGVFTEKGTILGKIFYDRDENRIQNQSEHQGDLKKPDEPGIPNVALYLEDGTRVITDNNGKFSILGIMPGTHVLRVDQTTLPKGMALVPLSNRFLGDGASQFVDMRPSGVFQADFAVEKSGSEKSERLKPSGEITPPVVQPESGKAEEEASSASREASGSVAEPVAEGSESLPAATPVTDASGSKNPKVAPEAVAGEANLSQQLKSGVRDWAEEIKTMTPDLDFLSPTDGSAVVREQIRVVFKVPFGMQPALSLNDAPVAEKQLGRKIDYEKGQVTIYEYIAIHLNAGETNTLQAEIKDPFGNTRGTKRISVTAAGSPERIVIQTDKAESPADGESGISVTVELHDRQGRIVPYAAFVTVSVSAGEIIEKDADPTTEGIQITLREGIGRFTVRAPRETGEALITAEVDRRQETARVFFSPNLRNLFLVGTGELTIGHGGGKGNYKLLNNTWSDNNSYASARGAFFLKGEIYEGLLLTAAFDSDKKKQADLFRENDTNLDGEDKYPIYGDESRIGYEAVSADKLYVKLEKNRSSLLYGDFKTDLNETRLAPYNRSFNGLKYDLNSGAFKLRSFGSYTDQTQVMDILPGKGISGYYYLKKRSVIEGSERVTIEKRDRYRPDIVLNREPKGRGSDYEIDYELGAILFKEPIPSHNSDFNPVYIVVSYESRTLGEKYYIYGGRGAFSPYKWLEIGGTGVIEEKTLGNAQLTGADLTVTLPRKTIIKAEYAKTKTVFEEAGLFDWRSGEAWSVSMESEPVDKLLVTGYYRTLTDYFLNLSAVDSSRGTTKYGIDAAYALRPETLIKGRFFNERDDLNSMKNQLASLSLETKFKKTKITGAITNQTSTDNYIPLTDSNSRIPFDISQDTPHELTDAKLGIETELRPDLSLTLSHKQNLSQENYHMSQAGLNYQLNKQNRLYLREEYQKHQRRDETRTLLGVETQLAKNTVAYNEYRLADGAEGSRNQNVLGLRNKFFIGKNMTGNAAAEYLKTISGPQRSAEPDAVAGSLGLEYLAGDQLKATSRFEHRRELINNGRDSYLGELGVAYKLHPDYSLLMRERYFTENNGSGGQQTTTRTMLGVAYRPLLTNRFNALSKVEYKHESNTASIPAFSQDAWIISGEGVWQASPWLQITCKYAGKLVTDDNFSSYTDIIAARLLYDLTDRWDVGVEYRILSSHAVNSFQQGGDFELGYRVIKNLWLSVGYSFDKFDADLAGDAHHSEGPYLKLRVKIDESTFRSQASSASK